MRWTERMRMFCWHVARVNEGAKAAGLAGYEGNPNSLRCAAVRLMKQPEIRAEIRRQRQYYLASQGTDKDRLLAETLARAGITLTGTVYTPHDFVKQVEHVYKKTNKKSGDTIEFKSQKWTLVPKEELPLEARRMVQSIKISYSPGGEENIEVKFFDQLKAIELAGRLAKLLSADKEDDNESAEEKAKKIREALLEMNRMGGEESGYVEPAPPDGSATH